MKNSLVRVVIVLGIAFLPLSAIGPAALAQDFLKDLTQKAAEEARRAAEQKAKEALQTKPQPAPASKASPRPNEPAMSDAALPSPGGAWTFLERTTPQAGGPRTITHKDQILERYFGPDERSRWIVTNRYLPADRLSFGKFFEAACMPDGTLFVAAGGLVSAGETGRPPQGNRVWYADDGIGVWRVDPDGRVTPFALRDPLRKIGGQWSTTGCNIKVAESAIHPSRWGGLAVSPNGDVYVSETEYHVILKLRGDGYVEHVAGGGENACVRDPWKKTKKPGYQDGPGRQALFKDPGGLAFDRGGNLLVADWGNCALRRIDPAGNVTTVRKGCSMAPDGEGKPEKRINYRFVVMDPQGLPVVGGSWVHPSVDIYSNIHRLHPDGRVEQLLSALKGYANSGQPRVEFLNGLAYLPDGTLLISDDANNLVRKLERGRLSDWIGASGERWVIDMDGPASQARVQRPGGLCAAGDGTVFIKPVEFYRPLRKVDGKTLAVSTWLY